MQMPFSYVRVCLLIFDCSVYAIGVLLRKHFTVYRANEYKAIPHILIYHLQTCRFCDEIFDPFEVQFCAG